MVCHLKQTHNKSLQPTSLTALRVVKRSPASRAAAKVGRYVHTDEHD